MKYGNVHEDLCQLSYGRVTVKSYGRYDVNGFRFRSAKFEASRPLAATTNTGVVTRAIDAQGSEMNFYGIIQNILQFKFVGNKELKVVFFDCVWFDNKNGTRQNQFGMVEVKHNEQLHGNIDFILAHQVEQVYYMPYPCTSLGVWWVVYKVNPRERLHSPGDAGYHDSELEGGEVDEVYQDEELSTSFHIEYGSGLDSLVGDREDITNLEKRKRQSIKKKVTYRPLGRRRLVNRDVDEF